MSWSAPGQEDASADGWQLRQTSETGRGGAWKASEDLWHRLLWPPFFSLRGIAPPHQWGFWAGRGVAQLEEAEVGRSFGASLGSGLLGWRDEVSAAGNGDLDQMWSEGLTASLS